MYQYLDLMREVRELGSVKTDRTGTGTVSKFGHQMRFDLSEGLPLLTTKKVSLNAIIHELIWFLAGDTNVKYLQDNGVTIWDEWADEKGELGPVYGAQWRRWEDTKIVKQANESQIDALTHDGYKLIGFLDRGKSNDEAVLQKKYDQIGMAMEQLKNNPHSRRIIVSSWNVGQLSEMKLMPCHSLFQFYVEDLTLLQRDKLHADKGSNVEKARSHAFYDKEGVPRQRLSCQLYQRSADIFLGVPFNIASYAILTHMFADQLKMAVGEFIWTGGDCHLYANHAEQAELQLTRDPKELPKLVIVNARDSIFDYKYEDFMIIGYEPDSSISAPVAV